MARSIPAAEAAGYHADVEVIYDTSALQAGAALAIFADLSSGARIGSDRAGAPGRRSETIGTQVARRLLEDLKTGALSIVTPATRSFLLPRWPPAKVDFTSLEYPSISRAARVEPRVSGR